ncbi:phytoene desaturase family protein [Saccharopolyspora sp. ASAGF58]|uniref:phytoene desaturase family protein n=1 Tax=Saccharopolyspora sp. ASAGF58 TaxID=2719023 RepID=UPI00143FD46F|nr:phytoene desaturase family protein [Saccharopolyspora sp. ASAGF58]QIZ37148.1 phytoene desaturase [Saccharopolyspora sp. ASAGF58]
MRVVGGPTDRIVVVGAGLAGLASALHLAGRGREVTVVERNATPGGRAGRLDLGGYRLDTGPTVLTMPDVVADTLAAVGEALADRLDLHPVHPAYRAQFADGSRLDVHSDPEAMTGAVREFAGPADAEGYRRLRSWLTKLYRLEFDRFVAANTDSPFSLLTPSLARLAAMGAFGRLERAIGRFLRDERLRRVFSFQSLYVGLSPQHALAAYAVISYMDTVAGVSFPRGGMRALPDALAAAACAAGVRFHYRSTVVALEKSGSRVRAVRTADGRRFPADAVVLTTELPLAYRLLGRTPRRPLRLRAAPSAVVLHVGARQQWPDTAHHTILFGEKWRATLRELIWDGSLMSDPSLLVTRPTATDPALAPEGRDLVYILAPAPNSERGRIDWDRVTSPYVEELLAHVSTRLLPGVDAAVEVSHAVTPADWERAGMVGGTPFALAHTAAQTGPFRPRNLPRGVENAVLAGGSTVPGVGVPTTLISGRLAADRITGTARPARTVLGPAATR